MSLWFSRGHPVRRIMDVLKSNGMEPSKRGGGPYSIQYYHHDIE